MDWIEFPFEVWARVHASEDAPVVRLRWVYTDQPFLPVGTQSVVMNRIWELDQESDLVVGQLPKVESKYKQDARLKLPALAFSGHMCHPEWFATGEPWPVPSILPPTVYLDGWIPECCAVCCVFIGCSLDPVDTVPSSQHTQFPVAAVNATGATHCVLTEVGGVVAPTGPPQPGARFAYFPTGRDGNPGVNWRMLTDGAGVMEREVYDFQIDEDNYSEREITVDGFVWKVSKAGDITTLTFQVVGGQGKLCGTNLRLCAEILPDGVTPRATAGYLAAGTTQAGATAITTTGAQVAAVNTAHGVRLPTATSTGNRIFSIVHVNTSGVASCKLYPASGQALSGLAVDAPYTLPKGNGVIAIENCAANAGWTLIAY